MGTHRPQEVRVERVIRAPAQRLFDLVADPSAHAVLDGSGTVKRLRTGPHRLSHGARFGMAMRVGVPYPVTNTVVEFEDGRLLAWHHIGRARWRYRFEPVEEGTKVTETWDFSRSPPWYAAALRVLRYPRRNQVAMERTLERLEAEVARR